MAQVNKQAIAAAFGRAATHYEQHAELQRQSADALLAQLDGRAFSRVLDAGCGPGRMSRYWREQGVRSVRWIFRRKCWLKRSVTMLPITICWRISKPFRRPLPLSTWPGAIWPCSGAATYAVR